MHTDPPETIEDEEERDRMMKDKRLLDPFEKRLKPIVEDKGF